MSGEFPFATKIVSPLKCIEKPWDLWVSEIGHLSPRRDEEFVAGFPSPSLDSKSNAAARRPHETHPYKFTDRALKIYRRAGVNRLRYESMSLHGLFPQMDNLNAAVCHMCGVTMKCSAAYRHLLQSHTGAEPILPPPPPTVKLKSTLNRSRHKKEAPPPVPIDIHPLKMKTSPVHTAAAPLSRIVLPQTDLQYLEEASTSSAITEVQVSMESGELPVVSIQDTEELPLGENITDDIFAIMNSEGIQSADDITNVADWKNIIRDIGNMQEINFPSTTDTIQTQDLYSSVDTTLSGYTLTDSDLSSLQFPSNPSPLLSTAIDNNVLNAQALKQTPTTPSTKTSRKSSKTKFNLREYDPNKHCGVVTAENPKPCTRSLTCKAHALSLRRTVEGRSKPFDTLLAEHRASRDAPAGLTQSAPSASVPPLLVNTSLDLGPFNGLTAEQQVNDIYASLLSVEDPLLPDTSGLTSLLSQPLPETFLMPDDAEPLPAVREPPPPVPQRTRDLLPPSPVAMPPPASTPAPTPSIAHLPKSCWYSSSPRPLALCTFNASQAGGAITLGKKFATVRNDIKTSLSRSSKFSASSNNYYGQGMSLSKSLHMNNANKSNKPEIRKLIVTCSAPNAQKDVQQTLNDLFGPDMRNALNGHVGLSGNASHTGLSRGSRSSLKSTKRPSATALDLGFPLDPLLADEKC